MSELFYPFLVVFGGPIVCCVIPTIIGSCLEERKKKSLIVKQVEAIHFGLRIEPAPPEVQVEQANQEVQYRPLVKDEGYNSLEHIDIYHGI